ncbi:hypothetical protein OEA41_002853 [Lepraria neglecta]|uniref:Uncharacterized protein n=1 Tax=Lepraria neglecta TaxID=209136 RepID=A0AAE0DIH0_9LECA|nr:hypothetical protein OEA41_002853 [Lepraria neglecta]
MEGHAYKAYVGSGVGREGLLRRILDHLNPEFRKRNISKYLYRILKNPEVTALYLTLASFSTAVSPAVCYLTEATIALILGTYCSDIYKVIRLPGLPRVDWKRGMNMADSLIANDQVRLWKELAVSRRNNTLSHAISGGTTTIYASFKANGSLKTVEFYLCRLKFLIPLAIVREWTLTSSPTVNVD